MDDISVIRQFEQKSWRLQVEFIENLWQQGAKGISKIDVLKILQRFERNTREMRMQPWVVTLISGVCSIGGVGVVVAFGSAASALGLLVSTVAVVVTAILMGAAHDGFKAASMLGRIADVSLEFRETLESGTDKRAWISDAQRQAWSCEFEEARRESSSLLVLPRIFGNEGILGLSPISAKRQLRTT